MSHSGMKPVFLHSVLIAVGVLAAIGSHFTNVGDKAGVAVSADETPLHDPAERVVTAPKEVIGSEDLSRNQRS